MFATSCSVVFNRGIGSLRELNCLSAGLPAKIKKAIKNLGKIRQRRSLVLRVTILIPTKALNAD